MHSVWQSQGLGHGTLPQLAEEARPCGSLSSSCEASEDSLEPGSDENTATGSLCLNEPPCDMMQTPWV